MMDDDLIIKVKLDNGAQMPLKAHNTDAGYDIFSPIDVRVPYRESVVVDTGVHMQIPDGYCGVLKSKSGLNCNNSLTNEGLIDSGYTGSIKVKMYNNSYFDYLFRKGDKLTQIVILPVPKTKLIAVDELDATERGDNGIGSTGR